MDLRAVIALMVVLGDDLPVGGDLVAVGGAGDEALGFVGRNKLGEVADEPDEPLPFLDWTAAITELGDDGFGPLIGAFTATIPAGISMLQVRPLGGAISDPALDATGIVGHLESQYLVFAGAFLLDPSRRIDESVFGPFDDAVRGRTVPRTVATFLSSGQDLSDAYPPESLARLGRLKFAVDPDSLFRSNQRLPG